MEDKTLGLYKKLQLARVTVQSAGLKKTGFNKYSNYYYFQLEDFLPTATSAFKTVGITPLFNLGRSSDENGIEHQFATLTLIDNDKPEDAVAFTAPYAEANNSSNPIQNLGSSITYLRRYLYMMALDLSETDIVDSGTGGPEDNSKENAKVQKKAPSISSKQAELIQKLYTPEEIKTMLTRIKKNDLMDCTAVEAAKMIDFKKKDKENG